MDFNFIIQCGECPLFSCHCNYPYRKLSEFLYVHDYSFRNMIVLFYTCWHGHLLLGVLLAMFLSCDYYITGKIVNFYCGYLVKRKLPTFVSNQYTGLVSSQLSTPETDLYFVYLLTLSPNNWGFAGHVAILRLSHTWKACRLSLWLYHKEKITNFCINPIHRDFK